MKSTFRNIGFAALASSFVALGGAANAESNAGDGNESSIDETQAMMNAKISIADAIRAAELETKGKAVDSGINDENGNINYQVEIVAQDGRKTDVFVDLQTGKIIKMTAADSGDENASGENNEGDGANGGG